MDLQNKIYTCRKNAGLSQEALAEKISVSRQAISKWETGEATPEVAKLLSLAKTFGVTTDWMLSDDPDLPEDEQNDELPADEEASETVEPSESDVEASENISDVPAEFDEMTVSEQEPEVAEKTEPEPDVTDSEPSQSTPQNKWQRFIKGIYDRFGIWSGTFLLIFCVLLFIYGGLFDEFAVHHFGTNYIPLLGNTNIFASYGALLMCVAIVLGVFAIYLMFALRKFKKTLTFEERLAKHEEKERKKERFFSGLSERYGWAWAILIPCIASLFFSLGLVMSCSASWFIGLLEFVGSMLMMLSAIVAIVGIVLIIKLYRRVKSKKKTTEK